MRTEDQQPDWTNGATYPLPGTDAGRFFSERVPTLYPRLLRFARVTLRSAADAEDVVQQSLLKAYRHLHEYRGEANFSSWVQRITWNECMNLRRKPNRESASVDHLTPWQENHLRRLWAQREYTPEQAYYAREIHQVIRASLQKITPCYAAAWALKEMALLSHAEIATRLGITVSTAKVRIHRARLQLRQLPAICSLRPAERRPMRRILIAKSAARSMGLGPASHLIPRRAA